MTGVYYLLRSPEAKQRLVDEVRTAWPVLDEAPSHEELEKLPFLANVVHLSYLSCSNDGTDCCHQRDAALRRADTRWPSTRSATIWCHDI
jgi:hypothetical protein